MMLRARHILLLLITLINLGWMTGCSTTLTSPWDQNKVASTSSGDDQGFYAIDAAKNIYGFNATTSENNNIPDPFEAEDKYLIAVRQFMANNHYSGYTLLNKTYDSGNHSFNYKVKFH